MNKVGLVLGLVVLGTVVGSGRSQQVAPAAGAPVGVAPAVEDKMPASRMRRFLDAEKFDELDGYADKLRRDKSREIGGGWKLTTFYGALEGPRNSDQDTIDHLAHIEHWMTAKPDSITARIVMARSLITWAWVARGNGTADTITPRGVELFKERSEKALRVLKGAQDMKPMDPQWFAEMLMVGTALNWTNSQMRDVYERSAQFDPEFTYSAQKYANYLLPKWDGKPGDAAKFAKKAADRVGGSQGDLLYYMITPVIIRRGNGSGNASPKDMDWDRVLRGYSVMESTYGVRPKDVNELGLLAYKFHDKAVALKQFALIGNNSSEGVWGNRNYFNRARDWANGRAGDEEGAVTKDEDGRWE